MKRYEKQIGRNLIGFLEYNRENGTGMYGAYAYLADDGFVVFESWYNQDCGGDRIRINVAEYVLRRIHDLLPRWELINGCMAFVLP